MYLVYHVSQCPDRPPSQVMRHDLTTNTSVVPISAICVLWSYHKLYNELRRHLE